MTDELTRVMDEEARRTDAEGKWPERSIKTLAETGLLGLTLPRENGGEGAGMRKFAEITEEIAKHCASTAMIYLMHVCGAQAIAGSSSPRRVELLQKVTVRESSCDTGFQREGLAQPLLGAGKPRGTKQSR